MRHLLALLAAAWLCTPPASAQPAGGELVAIGSTFEIASDVYAGPRRVTVRLPAEYAQEPERRFPVMYLMDGGADQDFVHIAGLSQSREINGSFAPFILVGIETVDRRAQISPSVGDDLMAQYEADFGATPGGADTFRTFLESDVIPWVESNFRTGSGRALMGESLAGLFVIDTLLERPDLFDDWIVASPSLWWDNLRFAKAIPARLAAAGPGDERIYLSMADEGLWMEEGVERLVDALRDGAPDGWQWLYVPYGQTETHGSHYDLVALDAWRLFYGNPTRIYKPYGLISGIEYSGRTPEEEARLENECTRENSLRTTPAATRAGQDRLYYKCLLYDTGPVAREGNFDR